MQLINVNRAGSFDVKLVAKGLRRRGSGRARSSDRWTDVGATGQWSTGPMEGNQSCFLKSERYLDDQFFIRVGRR